MYLPRSASVIWRAVTILGSLAGLAAPAILLGQPEVQTSSIVSIFAVCAIPSTIGLVAALASLETRTRILLLWAASLLAGFTAVIALFAGPGIVMLGVMLAYLLAAWGLNEAGEDLS